MEKIDPILIDTYMQIFINRFDMWGKAVLNQDDKVDVYYQKPDQETFGGRYPFEPVTSDLVQRHIFGNITCSWTAVDKNWCSKWCLWDSDNENGDIAKIERLLTRWGFTFIREAVRPGRDGHLWLPVNKPILAKKWIYFGTEVMKHAGVELKADGSMVIEFFPKYEQKLSQIRGPLGKNIKIEAKGAIGWIEGLPKDRTIQLQWLKEQPLNDASKVTAVANKLLAMDATGQKKESRCKTKPVSKTCGGRHRVTAEEVAKKLPKYKKKSGSWWACCPSHDDKYPSLKLDDGDKCLLVTCWKGCDYKQIKTALEQRGIYLYA